MSNAKHNKDKGQNWDFREKTILKDKGNNDHNTKRIKIMTKTNLHQYPY